MDEKKEDVQDNDDFLSGHEDLLNSINTPDQEAKTTAPEPKPVAEPPPTSVVKPKPATPQKKQTPQQQPNRNPAEIQRHKETLKHQALEDSEVKEVLNVILKYAKPAVTVVVIVCVFFLTNSFFKNNRIKKEIKADTALMKAHTATAFQAILDDFGSTPSAPLAMMGLAQEQFNAGQIDDAEALYGKFIKEYGKHEMIVQAKFNQITCTEAKGDLQGAAIRYADFAKEHKNSHLAPVALLAQAKCLELQSKFAEAKQAYEDLMAYYPKSGWAQSAERKLKVLQSKLK